MQRAKFFFQSVKFSLASIGLKVIAMKIILFTLLLYGGACRLLLGKKKQLIEY